VRRVYADTSYWLALFHRGDDHHEVALRVSKRLGGAVIVTSEAVLVEFLNFVSKKYPLSERPKAMQTVRDIQDNPNVETKHSAHRWFDAALDLYGERPDKDYSMTDCMSMCIMRDMEITEALTSDRHFEQEGFSNLLQ